LHTRALDGRTDLFALGATLYYALVSRHAYDARDFKQLPDAWQTRVRPPSELLPGIPEVLDALVLELLQLDADARPASASELIVRLSALLDRGSPAPLHGATQSIEHTVAQAYLAMPKLVARDAELARVRGALHALVEGRGLSILVEGEA